MEKETDETAEKETEKKKSKIQVTALRRSLVLQKTHILFFHIYIVQ